MLVLTFGVGLLNLLQKTERSDQSGKQTSSEEGQPHEDQDPSPSPLPTPVDDSTIEPGAEHVVQEASDTVTSTEDVENRKDDAAEKSGETTHGSGLATDSNPAEELTVQNAEPQEMDVDKADVLDEAKAESNNSEAEATNHTENEEDRKAQATDEASKKTDDDDSGTYEIVRGEREGTPASDMDSQSTSEKVLPPSYIFENVDVADFCRDLKSPRAA